MKIRLELILGIVLFLAAFAVLYLVANVINPPMTGALVAVQDIAAGDSLTAKVAQLVEVSIPDPSLVITEDEATRFSGAIAVEAIHRGELLQQASFVLLDNPAARTHTALGLENPDMAAFVVPVDTSTAPSGIQRGDFVDVILGIGGDNQMMGERLTVINTADQSTRIGEDALPPLSMDTPMEEADSQQEVEDDREWISQDDPAELLMLDSIPQTDEQSSTAEVLLPIAKVLVRSARVLEVVYEESAGSSYNAAGEEEAAYGEAVALVLEVPVETQELLTFALANGQIRVGLRSPLAQSDRSPTLGMSWSDLAGYFMFERELSLLEWFSDSGGSIDGGNLIESIWEAYYRNDSDESSSVQESDLPREPEPEQP
ncbi:MAG: hypothetical protein JXA25_19255 [Anaerolineales bacterium]|nr:hypothetical protein [Anaerolineales bacterium]